MRRKPYPWNAWFNAIAWPDDVLDLQLVKDFTCSPETFVRMWRKEAQKRGVQIAIQQYKPRNFTAAVRVRRVFRHAEYPWEKWLDGREHILVRNVDFDAQMSAFGSQVHGAARRRGQKVTTETKGHMMRVQALTPPGPTVDDGISEALKEWSPDARPSLAAIEAMLKVRGLEVPQARGLGAVLREAGWGYKRSSQARVWVPPRTNTGTVMAG